MQCQSYFLQKNKEKILSFVICRIRPESGVMVINTSKMIIHSHRSVTFFTSMNIFLDQTYMYAGAHIKIVSQR